MGRGGRGREGRERGGRERRGEGEGKGRGTRTPLQKSLATGLICILLSNVFLL